MILHTIIDAADIFYQAPPAYTACRIGNVLFYGTDEPDGFHAARIVSTDLNDYLQYNADGGKAFAAIGALKEKDGTRQHGTDKTEKLRQNSEKALGRGEELPNEKSFCKQKSAAEFKR